MACHLCRIGEDADCTVRFGWAHCVLNKFIHILCILRSQQSLFVLDKYETLCSLIHLKFANAYKQQRIVLRNYNFRPT
jgi:hypothetical protein